MRKWALILALTMVGCENSYTADNGVLLNQPFELSFGDIATIDDRGLAITFVGVEEDSRCPPDVDCDYEGRAVVRLSLMAATGEETDIVLGDPWGVVRFPGTLDTLGYRISLLDIGPQPVDSGMTIAAEDYIVRIEVLEPWREGTLNLLDNDSYGNYMNRLTGLSEWRPISVAGDTLIVPVRYGGGCNEHNFYLIGACPPPSTYAALVVINVIHDANGDACKVYLAKTLKFDLSPLRRCGLAGKAVAIQYIGHTATVLFGL